MVCAVCLSMFLSSLPTPTLHQHYYNHITTQGPSSLKVVAVDTKDIDVSLDILPDNGSWSFTVGDEDHCNRGWRLLNVLQEAWWRLLQWIRLVKLTYQLRFLYDKTCTFEYIWSIQDDIAVYMTRCLRDSFKCALFRTSLSWQLLMKFEYLMKVFFPSHIMMFVLQNAMQIMVFVTMIDEERDHCVFSIEVINVNQYIMVALWRQR